MNAIIGLASVATLAPLSFGQDANFYRQCAQTLVDGAGGCGSLYPPLVAIVAMPLTWVSPTAASIVMTSIGLGILMIGVWLETRGQAPLDRVLVAVAAVCFAPVVYELLLGQVTFLISAALYPVIRRADGYRNGIPTGSLSRSHPNRCSCPCCSGCWSGGAARSGPRWSSRWR